MLFSLLFTLIAASSTVFAEVLGQGSKAARACREELEGVVYIPENCVFNYLKRIAQELVVQSPLLWTDQTEAIIRNFKVKYDVSVGLISPFGELNAPWETYFESTFPVPRPYPAVTDSSVVHAWATGEGFTILDKAVINFNVPVYMYNTIIWNKDGQMWTLVVVIEKANAPTSYC